MRERLISLMKQRSDALKDALSGILAQIEQQKQDESQRLVETTLYSLNILNSIKPPVSSSLPFAPIPPFKDSPSRRYFPPTQHSLGGSFLTFWQRNGELAVFGYSLSEEFNEVNQDLRQSFITQYFERQRFEFHPDNAPRYQILLGRLGDELLRNQGRNWRDEDGTSNPFPATTCQVFAIESEQRSVCGPFLQYWRTHGLSLDNKRSISFDESLALFGLPLTAPKMETNPDGGQVLTQWFERARFEYHPNNPVAYQVLLGRLGSEVAKLRMAQTP